MMTSWKTESIYDIAPEEFYALLQDNRSHIAKTFPVTLASCVNLEETIDFIVKSKEKQSRNDGYYFYLRNLQTQKLIGYVCIKNINPTIKKCELAYFIDREFEGQGITSKAVSNTIDYCFEQLQMNKIFICTSRINAASQRIATKHGFKHEGILREEFLSGDAVLEDIVYFGLLQSEYKK